jgi:hypothetical protein
LTDITEQSDIMGRKIGHRINGSLAIWYGISLLIVGLGAVIGLVFWLYEMIAHPARTSPGGVMLPGIIATAAGLSGYAFMRVGLEELDR